LEVLCEECHRKQHGLADPPIRLPRGRLVTADQELDRKIQKAAARKKLGKAGTP
jgi:hypothetical protein